MRVPAYRNRIDPAAGAAITRAGAEAAVLLVALLFCPRIPSVDTVRVLAVLAKGCAVSGICVAILLALRGAAWWVSGGVAVPAYAILVLIAGLVTRDDIAMARMTARSLGRAVAKRLRLHRGAAGGASP